MQSSVNGDEGAESNGPSCLVQVKPSPVDGKPIQTVVKSGKQKQESKVKDDELVDITEEVKKAENKMITPDSVETWSDPVQREKWKRLGMALDILGKVAVDPDNSEGVDKPLGKREKHLARTQASPFLGNSTVKRIMGGVVPSSALYDPFGAIDQRKQQQLLDRIEEEE